MTKAQAAIPALIVFVMGVALALPDAANIGVMILDAFKSSLCGPAFQSNVACQQMNLYIWTMRIIGILMVIGDIVYIAKQIEKGNLI